eukprot:766689-Hanusia_phi.AAC.1
MSWEKRLTCRELAEHTIKTGRGEEVGGSGGRGRRMLVGRGRHIQELATCFAAAAGASMTRK